VADRAYSSTTLDPDITTVWSALGDFHALPVWSARVRESVAEDGSAVGSVRRLTLEPDGRQVRERLVHHDAADHRFSYEFVGVNPFPVSFYRGTVHLLPITETGGTFLEWFGEFDTEPAQVEPLRARFTAVYAAFIDDLRTHLATP
jgi:hypothetical protein